MKGVLAVAAGVCIVGVWILSADIGTQPHVIGASAVCESGAISSSQTRQGTCSGHGGVKRWINER